MNTLRPIGLGIGVLTAVAMTACDAPPDVPAVESVAAAGAQIVAIALPALDGLSEGARIGGTAPTLPTAGVRFEPVRPPDEDFPDARFPRPESVRGLYVNAWASGSRSRMESIIELARETEVNAFVIDVKDATGYISHRTEVELAHAIGATEERRIDDLPALLDRLEQEGIYPIARIVIVKDPILTAYRPEFAIQDTAGGVWVDSKGISWLNPYSADVWRYHVDLAREVAKMGFPEIQWDYVRFPDAPESDLARAVYLGAEGRSRPAAIRGFLNYARSNLADLPVRTTADVFGVTTTFKQDVGTGQVWEELIDVVDVALPMVYPSHYWAGSFGHAEPNARPYEIVHEALSDAVRRSAAIEGAGLTRPWLQDFSLGAPIYAGAEVRAQIQATYDVGITEWVLWNPGSRYTRAALEPIGGFEREPLVRVGGVLAPVSRRYIVLDSIAEVQYEGESRGAGVSRVGDVADAPGADDEGAGLDRAESDATDAYGAESDGVAVDGAEIDGTEIDGTETDGVALEEMPGADVSAAETGPDIELMLPDTIDVTDPPFAAFPAAAPVSGDTLSVPRLR